MRGGRTFANLTITGEISGTDYVGALIAHLEPQGGNHMGTAWDFRTYIENIKNECIVSNKGTGYYVS